MYRLVLVSILLLVLPATGFAIVDQEKLYYSGYGYILYFTDDDHDGWHDPGEEYYPYPHGSRWNYDMTCWYASACNLMEDEGFGNPYLTGLRDGAAFSPATSPWGNQYWAYGGGAYRTFDDGGWQHWAFDFEGLEYPDFINAVDEFGSGSWTINPVQWSQDRIAEGRAVGVCLYSGYLTRGALPSGYYPNMPGYYHAITIWEIDEVAGELVITDSDDQVYGPRTVSYTYSNNDWAIQDLYPGPDAHINYCVCLAGQQLPEVSIVIDPDPPSETVTVPPGGSFGFAGTLTNNTAQPQTVDVWTMAIDSDGVVYGPFKRSYNVELAPYETLQGHFDQHVPNSAPLGFYDYIAYCGDYPATVIDSSFFEVEIIQGGLAKVDGGDWVLTGSFDRSDDFASVASEFGLTGNYPNPFNANTIINYRLPISNYVKLEVYNLLGEKVATLVGEKQEAGYYSVNWDASEMSSGIYFYRLTAGDYTETKRMLLVK
ncbi:MAG: T9SS type A sorting domain-containing protein [Candidatus Zixiibacteriota bacterium]